jgi:hypothetical protein
LANFTSFEGLIAQSFSYLTSQQASQLAAAISTTTVPGQNITYGQLFAQTLELSAHKAEAANVYYSGNLPLSDGTIQGTGRGSSGAGTGPA